ncbi:O-antigen ligase family protein [Microbulbifer sp. CAU 1566]|uniref:O-antigen ligase family protein n=1 Tax=Microbulbifer sp. CAU 1566 TaxID=2933269 RepID=UPI002005FDAF|nr:O-antigen ligase family protein [Microbulbifer sp. CAU 1566]MCK7596391.1 O-antigen ligase family protein [Microbulbifer sp. CAU 1566]
MSTTLSAASPQSVSPLKALLRRTFDRPFAIGLLLCSFIWVLPWSRTFQLSVLVLAITAIALLIRDRNSWKPFGIKPWCLMNLLAAAALALSAAGSEYTDKPIELAAFQLILMLAGIPVLLWARNDAIWHKLQLCLLAIIGFWLVDGLFQALVGFDLFGVPRAERLGGYFSHPDKFGYYIAPLCAWVLFAPAVRRLSLPLQSGIYLLCLAVTFFGNTRAGWAAFALISLIWLYTIRQQLRASIGVLCLLAAAALFAGWWIISDPMIGKRIAASIPQSLDMDGLSSVIPVRIQLWGQAWEQFLASPWLGTGAGNYVLFLPEQWADTHLDQPYAHQVVFEILAGAGIVGCALFLAVLVCFLRIVWHGDYTQVAESRRPLAPLIILLCTWFPLSTHRELFSSEMMVFTWLCIALVIARSNLPQSEQGAVSKETSNSDKCEGTVAQ